MSRRYPCPMCDGPKPSRLKKWDLCPSCVERDKADTAEITRLMDEGHSYHCAARQTWSEPGTCEGCPGVQLLARL